MIDWTKQTEDMFKTWNDTQKKMWDTWLETFQRNPAQVQMADTWKKTVETWEGMVKNFLATQTEWTHMWIDSLNSTPGISKEVVEWVRQSQEMTQRWTEAQQQLWGNWFNMVKQVDPGKMPANWESDGQKMFQSWQESTQKIMDAQAEWARAWTAGQNQARTAEKN